MAGMPTTAAQLTLQQGQQMSERLSAIAAASAYASTAQGDVNGGYGMMAANQQQMGVARTTEGVANRGQGQAINGT